LAVVVVLQAQTAMVEMPPRAAVLLAEPVVAEVAEPTVAEIPPQIQLQMAIRVVIID
jgi:hypothetical protein